MKGLNKVIAVMIMTITFVMPVMAGNGKKNPHNDKKHTVVVVTNNKMDARFHEADKKAPHFDAHKKPAYHPVVKTCVIKVGRHDSHKKVMAKVEHMKGVMDTRWNPRTRELAVIYDAKVTTARHIYRFVA